MPAIVPISGGRRSPRRRFASPGGALALALVLAAAAARTLCASPYGVNAHIPSPELLDAVAASGARWVRVDFSWALVEPERGSFAWETYDTLADEALARGLHLYATISDTPAWATDGPAGTGVPRASSDFYDLCYRAAARYRGRIEYWGMWNEPNDSRFWAGSRDEYIDAILTPGAQAIHAANPAARVCGPELAHLQSLHWDSWLRTVLSRASGELDVVTHHLYPDGASARSVMNQLDRGSRYPWDPPSVRKVLQDAGWFGRPFWLTETGCGSGAAGEAAQAAFVADLLEGTLGPGRSFAWVDKVFFYEISDDPRYPQGFGLLGPPPAFPEKVAFRELQRVAAEMLVDDAEVVRVDMPRWLRPGAAGRGSVEVRNVGTTTWTSLAGYRLAAGDDADPLAAPRHDLDAGDAVAPGETRTFAFDLVAPATETLAGQPLVSDWRMLREGLWRFGETARAAVAVSASPPGSVSYLPFASGLVDGAGRRWRSDVVLHNRGAIALSAAIDLLVPGADNSHPRAVTVSVAPGAVVTLADVVAGQLGAAGRGVLRVAADSDDLLAACVTTVSASGARYGALVPATPGGAAISAGAEGSVLRLAHGPDAAAPRTDLLLLNPAGEPAAVEITLLDDDGAVLGGESVELGPLAVAYREDVLGAAGAGAVAHGRADLRVSGGSVLAWALTSDGRSGDPTVTGSAVPLAEPFLLEPAASTSRLRGGAWRTDVLLAGAGGEPAEATLTLLTPAGQAPPRREVELPVPAGPGVAVAGALETLFSYRGAGALLVTPRSGAIAVAGLTTLARVPVPFGHGLDAVPAGRAVGERGECRLFPITRAGAGGGTQTHLGLVNLNPAPIIVTVRVYDAAGTSLGVLSLRLVAGEWRQVADVLKAFPAIDGGACRATVRSSTPDARFLAYATVVDGTSGDPMLVPCS
jgi:polysaccharide biosynthesis protein PslG